MVKPNVIDPIITQENSLIIFSFAAILSIFNLVHFLVYCFMSNLSDISFAFSSFSAEFYSLIIKFLNSLISGFEFNLPLY